jgi:UDP-3-O-[3-hydroxymyristoyl] glucosamine N-acyltransferase
MKLADILKDIKAVDFVGNPDVEIVGLKSLAEYDYAVDANNLFWVSDKNLELAAQLRNGSVICSRKIEEVSKIATVNYIVVDRPRQVFSEILVKYFYQRDKPEISHKAFIHESVIIGSGAGISAGAVIEENCSIGAQSIIGYNTVILKNTRIGNSVVIGSNCTIGGNGFGYEKDEHGDYMFIPHIGNVVIEDGVEIGNNTCIDRGVLSSTIIRKNSKIDNLVHIAHGVEIGENSLVIANAMIAGSTRIGRNVWVAPSSSINNGLSVGDNSVVGTGAVVTKHMPADVVWIGNPARDIKAK